MRHYAAPWGKLLVVTSLAATLICVGVSIFMAIVGPSDPDFTGPARWVVLAPVLIVAISALFMVRGYVVTADEILVRRPLWTTRFERSRLQSAAVDHEATSGSIRLIGNGGLFSFTGLYRSPKLGRYRAFVTDPGRAVVLRFADRVVVVSPANPEAFVQDVAPRR